MRAVIQRVSKASVTINDQVRGEIGKGLVVLLGISPEDTLEDVKWLANKILSQRIFSEDKQKMNWSIKDIEGEVLLISQFTLYASIKKGNRPSFTNAAKPELAIPLYESFIKEVIALIGKDKVATGEFGADMKVALCNDGPVTLIIDTKNKE